MNYEIGNYKAGDLSATVDVSKVTKEGQYVLDIDVKSNHSSDSCTIVSVSPSTVAVEFDRISQKSIQLEVESPSVSAADGFSLSEAAVSPNKITLNGPVNSLAKVTRAVAKVNSSAKLSEDRSFKADEIVLYDADNNVVTDSSITRDENQTFTASFIVYKKKTLKLKLDITGAPENFDVSSLPITYSQQEITINTPNLGDKDSETLIIGTVPLSQLRLGWQQTFDIPLSSGEVNLSGESKVTVTLDSRDYTTNVCRVSQIITKNKPDGKQVEIETKSLPAVTIIGPSSDLENLQDNDLVASVDLSDVSRNGSYSKAATISISGHSKVWCFGSNEVQVAVSDRSAATTTTKSDD
jgi:YbbR domain-containing protein